MTIYLPEDKGNFELTPQGSHVAACYRVIDLGTQQVDYQGQVKHQHKIMIGWELSNELMSDGRPFSVQKRFTLSSSKKSSLRPFLEAWRGVPFSDSDFGKFDIGKLIAAPCMLGIVHDSKGDKTYANISSIMRLPKGMETPKLVNDPLYFSLGDFSQGLFNELSEGLQAVIARSPEYQKLKGSHAEYDGIPDDALPVTADDLSEIPF